MLSKTLLAFTIVCNCATLFGLWIAYEAAPATLQASFGHALLLCGATASIILYAVFANFVMKPTVPERDTDTQEKRKGDANYPSRSAQVERKLLVCSNGYPLQGLQSGIALHVQVQSSIGTKIVYAKAILSRVQTYHGKSADVELESSEPHILSAWEMFHLVLDKKEMQQEQVNYFLGPDTSIQGFIKTEEGNKHEEFPFQLITHRQVGLQDEDLQLRALQAKLQEADTRIATLSKPPDDVHVQLLCLQRGTTFDMAEATYFLKLNISCDEETGIKDIKLNLAIGRDVVEAKPMDDLSGWILRTPFKNKDYPCRTTDEHVMTTVSLWDKLQTEGLRSGLIKDGWLGAKIGKLIPFTALVSQLEIQITKSKQREPCSFTFTTFPEFEDVHVFDRAFRDPS